MLDRLDSTARQEFAQRLHQRVHAPEAAAERRLADLGFLTRLLDEQPQRPDRLAYIERKTYEQRRPLEAPNAPLSARLVERYGSWHRACFAAWGLLNDGRNRFGTRRPPGTLPGRHRPPAYTADECFSSVRACAAALGKIPSSFEYHLWKIERTRRAKQLGQHVRLPHYRAVIRELAPDRPRRGGWTAVVAIVFGGSRQP
jgi:hypothetical protein